jgi:uncharacterized protein (DUF433 family)
MSTVIAIRALRLPDMAGAAQLLLAACPHRADAPRSLTGNGHRAQRSHWSAFLPQAGNLVAYASLWRVSRDKFRFDRSSIRRAVTAFEILLTDAHGRGGGDVLRWKLPVPGPVPTQPRPDPRSGPRRCGKPCVRGTRSSVEFLLEPAASGATQEQLLGSIRTSRRMAWRRRFRYAADVLKGEHVWDLKTTG